MSYNIFEELGGKRGRGDGVGGQAEDWMIGVPALVVVNDDPEHMRRIKVKLETVDETEIHDEWVSALVPFVGPNGYGDFEPPALDSEVILLGEFGEQHRLFYFSVHNADFTGPAWPIGVRGSKVEGEYRIEADGMIRLLAGALLFLMSNSGVDVTAPLVRLLGDGSEVFRVSSGASGFYGHSTGQTQLPPPAITPSDAVGLVNAIRAFLISWGACK
jgi:hypothetical protein